MFMLIAFLASTTQLLQDTNAFHTCIPKTQFFFNGQLCHCDLTGRWSEANCIYGPRRQFCQQGQIIWQGCKQCKCNINGELICTDIYCIDKMFTTRKELSTVGSWCIPLKYYKVNCSVCFCPASGQTSEAYCTVNSSCLSNQQSQSTYYSTIYDTNCIPNVMYIFPCLQCLCSNDGKFLHEKCFEVCQTRNQPKLNQKCTPGTFYRQNCNVCRCPANGIPDYKLCTNNSCDINSSNIKLLSLKNMRNECVPYTFTKSKCFFCDCNSNGTINEDSCLLINCSTNLEFNNANFSGVCNSEEIALVCMECFCPKNGSSIDKYCTKTCNYQSKLNVLEQVLTESTQMKNLIEHTDLQRIAAPRPCEPNSVYFNEGKYCICTNGTSNFELCKTLTKINYKTPLDDNKVDFSANMPCLPNTFVEFDCNTCYCSKNGKIDPKWCTYDDCKAKRSVLDSHKLQNQLITELLPDKCIPGSIFSQNCNYCICPQSSLSKERSCTKTYCSSINQFQSTINFTCEPLTYYEVDCNVCYCPSDGLKNVAKCTKNLCEKKFLRSKEETCSPGQLFSEKCNVCLCPPNGNKNDRVCTNHTCLEEATWTNLEFSENLFEDRSSSDTKRNLDLCFPGEQFMIGCKHCVCPETGLKTYAECDNSQCTVEKKMSSVSDLNNILQKSERPPIRIRRDLPCVKYNISHHEKECTPGTMYIVRCKQCICPYMGNIMYFCRPLPKNVYCEQPFPNVQYEPMGRRGYINQDSYSDIKSDKKVKLQEHTKYECKKVGNVMDKCFICECADNYVLIEEHCFKSEDENCTDAKPSFLINTKVFTD